MKTVLVKLFAQKATCASPAADTHFAVMSKLDQPTKNVSQLGGKCPASVMQKTH